jgi:hypothetical protein
LIGQRQLLTPSVLSGENKIAICDVIDESS